MTASGDSIAVPNFCNSPRPVTPGVSLCMIVRDNERTLDACLAGITPWVDEVIIVDTGSLDRTPEIAGQHGAQVHYFPWCDDFSAARNESIRHASREWVFWMDSDDTIDVINGEKLRALAHDSRITPNVMGFVMQVHCPSRKSETAEDMTVVDHVKMFRNRHELRFQFRIHEQIIPSIRNLGGEIAWTDIFVVHSGSDETPEGSARKFERDLRILAKELEERPDHPFALFNLGMTYFYKEEFDAAESYLRRCLDASHPRDSHVRKAYALLVACLTAMNHVEEAVAVCDRGLALTPDDAELRFRRASLAHVQKRFDEAIRLYDSLFTLAGERHFSSLERGVVGFKARHNLGLVYQEMGRLDLAELQCRYALEEAPNFGPATIQLLDCLHRQGKLRTAQVMAEGLAVTP